MQKKFFPHKLTDKFLTAFIVCAGVFAVYYILSTALFLFSKKQTAFLSKNLLYIQFFFLLLFLFLLYYIYRLKLAQEKNRILTEEAKAHALEKMQYQHLISMTEQLREWKHDTSFHLNMIQAFLNDKKYAELNDYISSCQKELSDLSPVVSTGNVTLDYVLSNQLQQCKKFKIPVDYTVVAPFVFPLEDAALSSLLGNLFSNAIEACERLRQKNNNVDCFISFQIKPYQDMLLFHMENSYDGFLKQDKNGAFQSRKNTKEHGFGLKRVSQIVANANGILKFLPQKDVFIIHILIPLTEDISDETKDYDY